MRPQCESGRPLSFVMARGRAAYFLETPEVNGAVSFGCGLLFAPAQTHSLASPNMSFFYTVPIGVWLLVLAGLVVCHAILWIRRTLVFERRARREAESALTRTRQLEALATALLKGYTSLDISEAALAELLPAVEASTAAIALVNEDNTELAVIHTLGFADTDANPPAIPLAWQTLLTDAWRRREPVVWASQAHRQRAFAHLAVDPLFDRCDAGIVWPLLVAGPPLGVVSLGFARAHASPADERPFLQSAAQRIAHALDRAGRSEQAERARAHAEAYRERADIELRERQRIEEALRESEVQVPGTCRSNGPPVYVERGIVPVRQPRGHCQGNRPPGKAGGRGVLRPGRRCSSTAQFETLHAEEIRRRVGRPARRFPAESGLCATAAVETARPVFVGSFAEWQQQYPRSASIAADGGYASAAVLPLLVEGSAIGVLSFYFTVPVNFDEEYRALLTSVAQHCGAGDRSRPAVRSGRSRPAPKPRPRIDPRTISSRSSRTSSARR